MKNYNGLTSNTPLSPVIRELKDICIGKCEKKISSKLSPIKRKLEETILEASKNGIKIREIKFFFYVHYKCYVGSFIFMFVCFCEAVLKFYMLCGNRKRSTFLRMIFRFSVF